MAKNTDKGKTGKKADDTDTEKDSLAKELRGLIPQLDAEGLAFLVEQARIHIYNMQVTELNRIAEAKALSSGRRGKNPDAGASSKSKLCTSNINDTESDERICAPSYAPPSRSICMKRAISWALEYMPPAGSAL